MHHGHAAALAVQDERLGPTRFVPDTHVPRCHPGGVWVPPMAANAEERGAAVWFELIAGDVVLMDPLTWHYGSANTSESSRRMLLAMSFEEPTSRRAGTAAAAAAESSTKLRLSDLLKHL